MAETVLIDHVAHRGDGVAFVAGEAVFVPYTLGGETVDVEQVTGHPDRRRLLAVKIWICSKPSLMIFSVTNLAK